MYCRIYLPYVSIKLNKRLDLVLWICDANKSITFESVFVAPFSFSSRFITPKHNVGLCLPGGYRYRGAVGQLGHSGHTTIGSMGVHDNHWAILHGLCLVRKLCLHVCMCSKISNKP